MNIIVFFTESGSPKTGLSPIVNVWKVDGTQVVTDQAMTEVASGFYTYDFTTYDDDQDYCIVADGTSSLTGSERYKFSTNETAGVGKILQIEKGNWKIHGNQMIFYDTDGTTALYSFNLKDKAGTATEVDVFSREVV